MNYAGVRVDWLATSVTQQIKRMLRFTAPATAIHSVYKLSGSSYARIDSNNRK